MNISEEALWEKLEHVSKGVRNIRQANNESSRELNLPKAVSMAAYDIMLLGYGKQNSKDIVAWHWIREAAMELETKGWMTFK